MRNSLIIAVALVVSAVLELGALRAEEPTRKPATNPDINKLAMEAIGTQTLHVGSLRDTSCGGSPLVDQDANNAAFAACVMYVLGAVDMVRELQKSDSARVPSLCIPRTVSAGGLIIAIQEHIEAVTPWRQEQPDASRAIIAALATKWPCQRSQ